MAENLAAFEYIQDVDNPQAVADATAKAALGILAQAVKKHKGSVKLGDVVLVAPAGTSEAADNLAGMFGHADNRHAVVVFAKLMDPPPPEEPTAEAGA